MRKEKPLDDEKNPETDDEKSSEEHEDSIDTIGLSGKEKVAILLASLDLEQAAKILQGLNLPEQASTGLLEQVATLERIPPMKVKATIREGIQYIKGAPSLDNIRAGPSYLRSLLKETFGDKRSREMLRRMSESSDVLRALTKEKSSIFKFVTDEYTEDMVKVLKDEHPQTVALILGHVDEEVAGPILTQLPSELQYDVVRRLGNIQTVDLGTIDEIEEMLKKKLKIDEGRKRSRFYGIESAANVLNAAPKETQDGVLNKLTEEDPDLAFEIERELFRFESLSRLNDRELIRILQGVEPLSIAYAVRGTTEALREKILNNLPKRRRELVEEELDSMPDRVLIRDVDDAQVSIISIAQRMADEGEINLVFDESEYL